MKLGGAVLEVTALLPGLLFIFYFVPVIFVIWFMVYGYNCRATQGPNKATKTNS